MEEPAMAVRPVHHGRNREFPTYFRHLSAIFRSPGIEPTEFVVFMYLKFAELSTRVPISAYFRENDR